MSAHEILHYADMFELTPSHLTGETMHKTLQARISEEITRHGKKSVFYRTSAGKYFLRELSSDLSLPSRFLKEILPPGRTRPLPEAVLCVTRSAAIERETDATSLLKIIRQTHTYNDPRSMPNDLCAVGAFVSITSGGKILAHSSGPYSNFPTNGSSYSLGLRCYIGEDDQDLFAVLPFSIDSVAIKELLRTLPFAFPPDELNEDKLRSSLSLTVSNYDRLSDIAWIGIAIDVPSRSKQALTTRRRLDMNTPRWISSRECRDIESDQMSRALAKRLTD